MRSSGFLRWPVPVVAAGVLVVSSAGAATAAPEGTDGQWLPQRVWEQSYEDVLAGRVLDYAPTFLNDTDSEIGGVALRFTGDYAVTFADDYNNCVSDGTHAGMVECVVPGFHPEAGQAYAVDEDTPMRFKLDPDAPGPLLVCECHTGADLLGEDAARQYLAELGGDETGSQLELTHSQSQPGDPVKTGEPSLFVYSQDNPVDLRVAGTDISGTEGQDVPMSVSVGNSGPAWLGEPTDGEYWKLVVEPPSGVSLTATSALCEPINETDWPDADDYRPGSFVCTEQYIYPDEGQIDVEFTATINNDYPADNGKVTAQFRPDFAHLDADTSNNTATISLNS